MLHVCSDLTWSPLLRSKAHPPLFAPPVVLILILFSNPYGELVLEGADVLMSSRGREVLSNLKLSRAIPSDIAHASDGATCEGHLPEFGEPAPG